MNWCRVADQGCHRGITPDSTRSLLLLLMSPLAVVVLGACCLSLAVPSLAAAAASPPATHTLEDINHRLDMILNNTRSRENYIRCFMDRGICNKDALSIKRILADALANNCSNCTQSQRLGAERFFEYLRNKQPDTWTSLTAKYDPSGQRGEQDDDDDGDSDDSDDDDEKPGHKHNHPHGKGKDTPPSASGSPQPPQDAGDVSGTVPDNSTISMIF